MGDSRRISTMGRQGRVKKVFILTPVAILTPKYVPLPQKLELVIP